MQEFMYFHIPKNKYIFAKRRKSGTFPLLFVQNAHIISMTKHARRLPGLLTKQGSVKPWNSARSVWPAP